MKKKQKTPPPSGRRTGSAMAAAIPLALSLLPGVLDRANNAPGPTTSAPVVFNSKCEMPFDDIKTDGLEVDAKCTIDGNAGDDKAKRLENNAKNNFCVAGTATPIIYDDFKGLQEAADKVTGLRTTLKTNRAGLKDIFAPSGRPKLGEGTLVQFVAFVLDAHPSNVGKGKGENVNCKLPTRQDNDIHIELTMDPKNTDECSGVTAEMSPHFRPESWADVGTLNGADRPVRITGPLFFDDSHHPCHDGTGQPPLRISIWEIHPVYQFEVCTVKEKTVEKTLAACDIKKDSVWMPLDQWLSSEGDSGS
jgi:hypothetical protein